MNTNDTHDNTISMKLAGAIILALLVVFVFQKLGFRFVVSAGIGPK